MAEVFVSYSRADEKAAARVAKALKAGGFDVWWDRELPVHQAYGEVIDGHLRGARAVVVLWSEDAARSQWVRSEADYARRNGKLVQAQLDRSELPLPFDQIQYATLQGWRGRASHEGWQKLVRSVSALVNGAAEAPAARPAPARAHRASPIRWQWIAAAAALLLFAAAALFFRSSGSPANVSLAVLPFDDLSPTGDQAYFAEGISEEILSALAAEKDIKVLGRTTAREIDRNPDARAIRTSFGVTHLLEGSTRTADGQLRVNVRLVDTRDGSRLWEEEYQGRLADIFSVQDRIASTVVERLRGTVLPRQVHGSAPAPVDAYQTYLAARAIMRDRTKPALTRAFGIAKRIVETHPDYAPGHALYSELVFLLSDDPLSYGTIPVEEARRIAQVHARRAIRLAPDRADGYAAMGTALPWHQSVPYFEKAISLDPSRSDLRVRLGIALNALKRNDEAFEQTRLAVDTEPLSAVAVNRLIQALGASGQPKEAQEAIDAFQRRGGAAAQAWRFRGSVYGYQGDFSRSVAARQRALALNPDLPYQHQWLYLAYSMLGLPDHAARHAKDVPDYLRLYFSGDSAGLKRRLEGERAGGWFGNGVELAIFSLARSRDWPAIARFYDVRPPEYRDLCSTLPAFWPAIVMALQHQRRTPEAERLMRCIPRLIAAQLRMRYRSPDDAAGELEVMQATLLALGHDRRALDWLERASARGWFGQYYSSQLMDWPQFDALRDDPRYGQLQRRIDAKVAQERRELLAEQ